jgi:hypothetical protein
MSRAHPSCGAVSSTNIRDLTAVATVRRILLHLGLELSPDMMKEESGRVGAVELWVHSPHPDLEGRKPLDVLQTPEGEHLVRELLERILKERAGGSEGTG